MRMLSNEALALSWGTLYPMVKEALDHGIGETTPHQLFMECMSGNAQCWIHEDLAAITRFNHFPEYKQLQIVTVTGDDFFRHGIEALGILEQFARDTGCRNVSVWGRKGWKRVLQDYQEPYTVLVKEV